MQETERLKKIRRSEKTGRVARRLSMLIVMFIGDRTFSDTGRVFGCDRRTVSRWFYRYGGCRKSISGVRRALSDLPRSGRPAKVKREVLAEAEKWCACRPFTPHELRDMLEELSGVRLSLQQVRRYAKRWGYSRKKSQPHMINTATMRSVNRWRRNLFKTVDRYGRKGYAIVTMDESHFVDSTLSVMFWTRIGIRILTLWGGGHHRFSMMCSMTMDGRAFFNHCKKVNEYTFVDHLGHVCDEVGKMVLVVDKAPWHTSEAAKEFFRKRGIVVLWYPTGHSYLNPVEEVWGILKRTVDGSVRYADRGSHLDAVYKFIDGHAFDYEFEKFWKRRPPESLMRPFVKAEPPPDVKKYQLD